MNHNHIFSIVNSYCQTRVAEMQFYHFFDSCLHLLERVVQSQCVAIPVLRRSFTAEIYLFCSGFVDDRAMKSLISVITYAEFEVMTLI
jgi:hypothetical protein